MNKVQLTLTDQEVAILNTYGARLGYNLPRTLRYIISKASEEVLRDGDIPVYTASPSTEKKALRALKDSEAGKTISLDELAKNL